MRSHSRKLALLVALLLAGCSSPRMPPPAENGEDTGPPSAVFAWPDWSSETGEVQTLLAYYQRMLRVSADDLRKEFTAVNPVFNRDKTENARLKLVLLLSVPNARFRDDAGLVGLLENSLTRTAAPELPQRQRVTPLSRAPRPQPNRSRATVEAGGSRLRRAHPPWRAGEARYARAG